MRLLFDENVSPRLVAMLADLFPESTHISTANLRGADDGRIWEFARRGGYAIVSKDTDFQERSYLEGAPPKVVWLDVGNSRTEAIAELLRREHSTVEMFGESQESSVLVLSITQTPSNAAESGQSE